MIIPFSQTLKQGKQKSLKEQVFHSIPGWTQQSKKRLFTTKTKFYSFKEKRTSFSPSKPLVQYPIVHIQSTLNNTIITLTSPEGNTLYWASSGSSGFKNSRKSTSYAAQGTAEKVGRFCLSKNIKKVNVKFKGIGYGKESSLKALHMQGISIYKIEDVPCIPHNGCRPPKKRRM